MDAYLDEFKRTRDGLNCIAYTVGIGLGIYYVKTLLLLSIGRALIEIDLLGLLILNTDTLSLNLRNTNAIAAELAEFNAFVSDGCRREEANKQIEQVVLNIERATPISDDTKIRMDSTYVYNVIMIVAGPEFGILTYVYQIDMQLGVFAAIFLKFSVFCLCTCVLCNCCHVFFLFFFCFHADYDCSEPALVAMGCLMVCLIANVAKFGGLWYNIMQYMSDNYLFNTIFTQAIFKNFPNTFVIITKNINDTISFITCISIISCWWFWSVLTIDEECVNAPFLFPGSTCFQNFGKCTKSNSQSILRHLTKWIGVSGLSFLESFRKKWMSWKWINCCWKKNVLLLY